MRMNRYIAAIPLWIVLMSGFGCKKTPNGSESVPVPSDGRGGGVIAFSITPPSGNNEIYLMNSDGSGLYQLTDEPGRDCGPSWSPNGSRIAFYKHSTDETTWSIYVMESDGSNIRRLTDEQGVYDDSPTWSPDGTRIAFARAYPDENYRSEVWMMNADGSQQYQILEGGGPCWSPDGTRLTYHSSQDGDSDIYIAGVDGSQLVRLTNNDVDDRWPVWSPNGTRITFTSGNQATEEIYIMNADGTNLVQLTDNNVWDSGSSWSPDGERIAFPSFLEGHFEIYTINTDGTDLTRITHTNGHAIQPDWRPEL